VLTLKAAFAKELEGRKVIVSCDKMDRLSGITLKLTAFESLMRHSSHVWQGKVVLVQMQNGAEQLGFLTREDFADLPGFDPDRVAVYLPMSYQLGGFTVIVPRSRIREVPMKAEDALRFCVTAGVSRSQPKND
jgi:uncharacterized membrane protein